MTTTEAQGAALAAPDPDRVARMVRTLRKRRGWTQREAGERCGLHDSHIAKMEGRRIGDVQISTLQALARGFDVPLWQVVTMVIGEDPTDAAHAIDYAASLALTDEDARAHLASLVAASPRLLAAVLDRDDLSPR